MPNNSLFNTRTRGQLPKQADTVNDAGGTAYSLSPRDALTQYAMTGTFNGTYYANAETELKRVIELCEKVQPSFIVKLAIYSNEHGFMKDMPAALSAYLVGSGHADILEPHFQRIMSSPRILRTFVKMVRSGTFGRKSFGTVTRRMIRTWIADKTVTQLFRMSIGNDPSLADVIKMVHPKMSGSNADTNTVGGIRTRNETIKYMLGKEYDPEQVAALVQEFERFKKSPETTPVPELSFEFLSSLPLTEKQWKDIARRMSWTQTRMNLNTLTRHNVFKNADGTTDIEMINLICARLTDNDQIARAKVFPFQVFNAYKNATDLDHRIVDALKYAAEYSLRNVPVIQGNVAVCIDVSGSMSGYVMSNNGKQSSITRLQIAALFASALWVNNQHTQIFAFDAQSGFNSSYWGRSTNDGSGLYPINATEYMSLKPGEEGQKSFMDLANHLETYGGGGTDCSLPLKHFIEKNMQFDTIIYISDNESWADFVGSSTYRRGAGMEVQFRQFKVNNPNAKLVNIDIEPGRNVQSDNDRSDVLLVGGFNDNVFSVVDQFVNSNKETLAQRVKALV